MGQIIMHMNALILLAVFLVDVQAWAGSVTVPNTFVNGTTASAGEVNANFNAVENAVDDNDARIAALEAALAAHIADSANPKMNFRATTAPTVNDDSNSGYTVGSVWIDIAQNQAYILVDSEPMQAVWTRTISTYKVGQKGPAGGIVLHVTDGGLHGLEAAPIDQANGTWGCIGVVIIGADGAAVGTGAQNTVDILAGCAEVGTAAQIADAYELNGYTDWFLPSSEELNLLFQESNVIGIIPNDGYWSSTEFNASDAWFNYFDSLSSENTILVQGAFYKSHNIRVRVVREF